MTEKSQPENDKIENAHPENGRIITPEKLQKKNTWKMKEWKMYDMENESKYTTKKMIEKSCQKMIECKMHTQKIAETSHTRK